MGLVGRRHQDLGMLRARQQLLELQLVKKAQDFTLQKEGLAKEAETLRAARRA